MDNDFENQVESGGVISENLPGFGDSSASNGKVIFIGRGEGANLNHCWYLLEGDKDKPVQRYIKADTLTGELTGITLFLQESKKYGISTKVGFNLTVGGSTRYQIRTTLANAKGEPNVFIRGLLSLLLKCQPGAVTIGVQPSDEDVKIVFPKVIQDGDFVNTAGEGWLPKGSDLEAAIAGVAAIFGIEVHDKRNAEPKQQRKPDGNTNSDQDVLVRAKQWLFGKLEQLAVPKAWQEATLRHVLGNPTLNSGKLTVADIKRIRDEIGADGVGLKTAYDIVNRPSPAGWDAEGEFPEEPEGGLFPGDDEQF